MVETVCCRTVARVETFTTAAVYCVAPVEGLHVSAGVSVVTVVPGGDEAPGDKPVGVAGTLGADRVNATMTFWGVLVAPVAAMAMLPVYTPADRPALFTETVIVDGAVPD